MRPKYYLMAIYNGEYKIVLSDTNLKNIDDFTQKFQSKDDLEKFILKEHFDVEDYNTDCLDGMFVACQSNNKETKLDIMYQKDDIDTLAIRESFIKYLTSFDSERKNFAVMLCHGLNKALKSDELDNFEPETEHEKRCLNIYTDKILDKLKLEEEVRKLVNTYFKDERYRNLRDTYSLLRRKNMILTTEEKKDYYEEQRIIKEIATTKNNSLDEMINFKNLDLTEEEYELINNLDDVAKLKDIMELFFKNRGKDWYFNSGIHQYLAYRLQEIANKKRGR